MSGFFVAVQRLVRRWHIHWQSVHHREGANVYTQCRCGRKGWYPLPGGYSPLDRKWLDAPNAQISGGTPSAESVRSAKEV
jgi:hypothetical protein